ncbi:MAG: TIGR00730 family Rossman fold protein [Flavobacteriales bacterium]
MQVCVYCASSGRIHPEYFEATSHLAHLLVENNVKVVFGGGSSGLMGQLADSVLAAGGHIKGIMPQFMNEVEWGHAGVSDFIYTETMHERKAKFLEGTDALIALPGGPGTFEELFEAITLKKLAQFTKPIVILNTRGYFNAFHQLMQQAVDEHFMTDDLKYLYTIVASPEEVLPAIQNAHLWNKGLRDAGSLR